MEVTRIGPISLTRFDESPEPFDPDAAMRPGFVLAHIDVEATDDIDDGSLTFEFKTRLPITNASELAVAVLERQALLHLAQELRVIVAALDAATAEA
ncbi:hypothetical protein GCM10010873_26830 [Cypionkella aquatica]|uniref:Uncharacterized protein n=1 Tax=Cypionkella aquatica TaxID=1756042 RepID=A0AA37X245_9RHOB|nr:hypothetical protein [Cypionkella aquatica]GLS87709.1 hypothetical protein GCM10010873_26830 [Cypionkella aquatica]